MSIRGSFIIRHEFVQARTDKEAARTFVFKTIERLKEYFHLQGPDKFLRYEEDDSDSFRASFELPFLFDYTFDLYNDFWEVYHGYRFWQIMSRCDGDFWLRRKAFDVARALGEKEVWYASEYFASDARVDEYYNKDFTLVRWLDCCKKYYDGVIPEFDRASFLLRDEEELRDDCEEVYHDDFKDLFEVLKAGRGEK